MPVVILEVRQSVVIDALICYRFSELSIKKSISEHSQVCGLVTVF